MAAITKKRIYDDILNVLDRFQRTDEDRADELWLSNKIDQVRAQMIIAQFKETGIIDRAWLTDMGLTTFNEVNFADDMTITYCCSDVSKAFLPSVVSLVKDGADLGVHALLSACGNFQYTFFPLSAWKDIPKEHIRSKFKYYDRINTAVFVNQHNKTDGVLKLRPVLVLEYPEDGYKIDSAPIPSGSLVSGTLYIVRRGTVLYNGASYNSGDTFTATSSAYSGTGLAYKYDPKVSLSETEPYPVSADMARAIALDILIKEFGIEAKESSDVLNNAADDETK